MIAGQNGINRPVQYKIVLIPEEWQNFQTAFSSLGRITQDDHGAWESLWIAWNHCNNYILAWFTYSKQNYIKNTICVATSYWTTQFNNIYSFCGSCFVRLFHKG